MVYNVFYFQFNTIFGPIPWTKLSLCNFSCTALFVTFSCCQRWFKAPSFSTFPIFHKIHPSTKICNKIVWKRLVISSTLSLYYWVMFLIGHKIRNHLYYTLRFNVVSEYNKMKAHKVCILWSLLISSIIFNENNGNGKDHSSSIINNFLTSLYIISPYKRMSTGMAANIFDIHVIDFDAIMTIHFQ